MYFWKIIAIITIRDGTILDGFKINGETFGIASGGNARDIALQPGEILKHVQYGVGRKKENCYLLTFNSSHKIWELRVFKTYIRTCEWNSLQILSDVYFWTDTGRKIGPFGNCDKDTSLSMKYSGPSEKIELRVENLNDQIVLTSTSYKGNFYITAIKNIGESGLIEI